MLQNDNAKPCTPPRLVRCQRGAVSVEYLVLVGVAALSLAVTLVALGPSVVRSWAYSRHVLYGRAP